MSDDHGKEVEAARKILEEIAHNVVGFGDAEMIRTAWNLRPFDMAKEIGTHFQIFRSLNQASYSYLPCPVMQIDRMNSTPKQKTSLKAPATLRVKVINYFSFELNLYRLDASLMDCRSI